MIVNIKDLKAALKRSKLFISSRPTLPILRHALICASENRLTITGYDMEIGIGASFYIAGESVKNFTRIVPFANFQKIIDKLKSETVELEGLPESKLSIKSGPVSFSLDGKDPMDFPPLPRINPDDKILASSTIKFSDLESESKYCLIATKKDHPRNFTYHDAVLFHYSDDRLNLVGTDGRRLHYTMLPGTHIQEKSPDLLSGKHGDIAHGFNNGDYAALISARGFKAITSLGIKGNADIILDFSENLMTWTILGIGHGVIHLVDTPYPDYEKVIPDTGFVFRLDCKSVLEALEPLKVIAHSNSGRGMVIVRANGHLELEVKAESTGSAKAILDVDILASWIPYIDGLGEFSDSDLPDRFPTSDKISESVASLENGYLIAFNIDYFSEAIESGLDSPDGSVLMSGMNALDPGKFWTEDSPRITVLMPVRLPDSD